MYAVASDPKIWEQHPDSDRYTENAFRQFFNGAITSNSAFAFVDRANDSIFGSSRYHGYGRASSELEIGWTFLSRKYWGGSYNAEIKRLMLNHAFTLVDTVVFRVGEANIRSRRAVEKIGGELRQGLEGSGSVGGTPFVIYEIRKNNY